MGIPIDACHSGTLARGKGASRGPAYDIKTLDRDATSRMKGHVIITSSGSEELSQEADAVRGSYFSHYVLSGLRGAADLSQDGEVTLSELYHFAYSRTLARTSLSKIGPQHAVREIDLYGTGEVVLTRLRLGHAAILFPEGLFGTYYVVRKRGEEVLAEVELEGTAARIALPADTYLVRSRTRDSVLVSQMNLSWGGEHRFKPESMRAYPLVRSSARGVSEVKPSPHRLGLSFDLRNGVVDGAGVVPGVALNYARHLRIWVLGARGFWGSSTFEAQDTSVRNQEFDASVNFRILFARGDFDISVGLSAGLRYVYQSVAGAPDHDAFGGQFEAMGDAAYLLRDPLFLFANLGIGTCIFEEYHEGIKARPMLRLSLGVGTQF